MGVLNDIKSAVSDVLFPRRCPLCGEVIKPNARLCGECADELVYIKPPVCRVCGRPIYDCACDNTMRYYDRCVSPFAYTKAARQGLHRLKFHNAPNVSSFFGNFMADTVRREYRSESIDIITSVPMHPDELKRRGYNQAALLASSLSERVNIPVNNKLLKKITATHAQHTLPRGERMHNIHGVFDVARPYDVRGKTILLCDDIITTGATLDECARVLIAAGADRVLCATAAAVLGSSQQNAKRTYVTNK